MAPLVAASDSQRMGQWGKLRIGALDIAEAISERIGSYVDMEFFQFLAVEGDVVRCWYMNSGGKGPSFEVVLRRGDDGMGAGAR